MHSFITYPVCVGAITAALTSMAATVNLTPGWNLLGNSSASYTSSCSSYDATAIDVTSGMGDASKINTVWKWNKTTNRWAFYAPSMSAADLASYAQSAGYDVLTRICSKDGYWINAKAATALSSSGSAEASLVPGDLVQGWNLVASADGKTPSMLINGLVGELNIRGKTVDALWGYNSANQKWFFYAPSLDYKGGTFLSDYIAQKGYDPFASVLAATDGFWVNVGSSGYVPSVLFSNADDLENNTRKDSFTVQNEVRGVNINLKMCSQSLTNEWLNSIGVRLMMGGKMIASESQSYPSESVWGTPIPCFDHILLFPGVWLKPNDILEIETHVSSGTYKNILSDEIISVGDGVNNKIEVCSAYDKIAINGGFYQNNVWGSINPVKQCGFSRTDGGFGWLVELSNDPNRIYPNFPSLVCGWKPWETSSTTTLLPVALSDIKTPLIVAYKLVSHSTGVSKLTIDGWVTTSVVPSPQKITFEVMVELNANNGMVPDGEKIASVTIDGESFDLFKGSRSDDTSDANWTIYTFRKQNVAPNQGSVNFGNMLAWLVKNDYINDPQAVLSSIEFGDEVLSGRLVSILKEYSVKLGDQYVCQLP